MTQPSGRFHVISNRVLYHFANSPNLPLTTLAQLITLQVCLREGGTGGGPILFMDGHVSLSSGRERHIKAAFVEPPKLSQRLDSLALRPLSR